MGQSCPAKGDVRPNGGATAARSHAAPIAAQADAVAAHASAASRSAASAAISDCQRVIQSSASRSISASSGVGRSPSMRHQYP
jgi:hypothetical protein